MSTPPSGDCCAFLPIIPLLEPVVGRHLMLAGLERKHPGRCMIGIGRAKNGEPRVNSRPAFAVLWNGGVADARRIRPDVLRGDPNKKAKDSTEKDVKIPSNAVSEDCSTATPVKELTDAECTAVVVGHTQGQRDEDLLRRWSCGRLCPSRRAFVKPRPRDEPSTGK